MYKIKNKRKVESGKIFNAYFNACRNNEIFEIEYEVGLPFGKGSITEWANECFKFNNKIYTVYAYDHFNGHFSNFRDENAIYGLYIAEVYEC